MGKTIVEKIITHAAGVEKATAGEIVYAEVSHLMTNDAVGELTVDAFEKMESTPWDKDRIAVILDHYIPASTENAARVHKKLRDFCHKYGIPLFDQQGVCHQLMIEKRVLPGDLVIGTDSHTCTYGAVAAFATGVGSTDGAAVMATGEIWLKIPETIRIELNGALPDHVHPKDVILKIIADLGADGATYKALQFCGEGVSSISMDGRCTMCNMAIEAGAKTGIFEPDETTERFFENRGEKGVFLKSDSDAEYCSTLQLDLTRLVPQVSQPWAVDKVVPAADLFGTPIQQAFIGSCTNGRMEDLRVAAKVLEGKGVAPNVRLLVTPASNNIYQNAVDEGVMSILLQAGAVICNPGCSACFGGQGMLWEGEVCIGTHNRNFRGRMGHKDSKVFLASPETVAASAIAGVIQDPSMR